jgi:hypothetical protein
MIDRSRRYTSDEVAQIVREALLSSGPDSRFSLTHEDPLLVCLGLVAINIQSGAFRWATFPILFWLVPTVSRSRNRLFPSDELLTKVALRFNPAHVAG